MVLGLDTDPTIGNLVTGLVVICSIGLAAEIGKTASRKYSLGPEQRYIAYAIVAIALSLVWMIVYAGTYLPGSEVETAVIPGLHHWWLFPWEAPYGLIWYVMNWMILHIGDLYYSPIALIFHTPYPEAYLWMMFLAIGNLPFLYLFRKSQLLTAYLMTSLFLWFVIPWDLSILWIVCLGFLGQSFSARAGAVFVAAVAKFPVGSDIVTGKLDVWRYDLFAGNDGTGSAFVPGHWMPYCVLGAWSLAVLLKPYISFLSLDSFYGSLSRDGQTFLERRSHIQTGDQEGKT